MYEIISFDEAFVKTFIDHRFASFIDWYRWYRL